ncbi:MAG: gliding motility ABC transporter, partial [Bdellovibrionales bacterium]|nr:gliding motility ABC transporter [Bdellovibrionales bacterium]
ANKSFFQGLNRDLALNAFSYLVKETDLVSIRPKQPKGTQMILTQYSQLGLVGGGVMLPLVLLITAGVLWFKRRGA